MGNNHVGFNPVLLDSAIKKPSLDNWWELAELRLSRDAVLPLAPAAGVARSGQKILVKI